MKIAVITLLTLAACAPSPGSAAAEPPTEEDRAAVAVPPDPPRAAGDTTRAARLEAEARALARTRGCPQADQCRTAPVGSRPCGGPREYLAYCAASTDTVALFRKLEELRRTEQEINQRSGMMSTCEFREPPATELSGGVCRVAGP